MADVSSDNILSLIIFSAGSAASSPLSVSPADTYSSGTISLFFNSPLIIVGVW